MAQKILIVTRKFPPIKGGMERYSKDLYDSLSNLVDVELYANTKGNKYLPIFIVKSVFHIFRNGKRYSHIHFGDGLLAPLAFIARFSSRAKLSVTIHGLDITFSPKLYQWIIPPVVAKIDKIVCISQFTIEECVKRNIPRHKCVHIPNGIIPEKRDIYSKRELFERLRIDATDRFVLFSVGRHVKRKGFEWFTRQVMPRLEDNIIYLIGGTGKETKKIHSTIEKFDLQNRVYILGDLSDKQLYSLYTHTDLFVMPNVRIEGDVEGFGIVIIEATSNGAITIGANLEGISDAIIEGKTGNLVAPQCATGYIKWIHGYYRNKFMLDKIRKESYYHTLEKYHWNRLARQYITEIFEHEHEQGPAKEKNLFTE